MATLTFNQRYKFGFPLHVIRWMQATLRDHENPIYKSLSENEKCEFGEWEEDVVSFWDTLTQQEKNKLAANDFSDGQFIPLNQAEFFRQLDGFMQILLELKTMDQDLRESIFRRIFPHEKDIVPNEHRFVTLLNQHSIANLVLCLDPTSAKKWITMVSSRVAQLMQEQDNIHDSHEQ